MIKREDIMEMIEEKSSNWAMEKVKEIAEKYKEDFEALDLIADCLESFENYVNAVNHMEKSIVILRFRLEPEAFRAAVENLDKGRRNSHNALISSVKILNRFCTTTGLTPFYTGDVTDRVEVAEFAKDVVINIFDNRKK